MRIGVSAWCLVPGSLCMMTGVIYYYKWIFGV